jgi:3-dehydrosphinganine reductase
MKIKAKLEPGKIALVTGGSSGIGKAIACGLAKRGMHVWLVAQRKDLLASALEEVESHKQSQSQLMAVIRVSEKSGPPDLLVNSAGVAHPGYFQELDMNIFRWMMEVNYFGTVYMTKEVIPLMLRRGSGYIVNISSMAGFVGTFGYTAYGGSKFAVRGFSDVLRAEMKIHGIGVSIIFPPDTETAQLEYETRFKPPETKALAGNTKVISPDEVASETIRGIELGRYLILPGLETKLIYRLNGIFGGGLAFFMDQIIAKAHGNPKVSHNNEV